MSVTEIVTTYLINHHYDGLYNPDEGCGCSLNDLAPCDYMNGSCCPAYQIECKTCKNNGDCEVQREYDMNEKDHCFFTNKDLIDDGEEST